MSAYSTLRITRNKAKTELMKWLMSEVTDQKLEDFMDQLLESRLHNAKIVDDDSENDDLMV